jgi:hypothetical protein
LEEATSSLSKKAWLGWSLIVIPSAIFFGWLIYTASVVSHDKSVNSEVGILWETGDHVPLGTVVPPNNRWIDHAFIAERATPEGLVKRSILVLDDHYRSGDPTLRTETGVIGDSISREVLCSVPAQAKAQANTVKLDPVVQRLISNKCG